MNKMLKYTLVENKPNRIVLDESLVLMKEIDEDVIPAFLGTDYAAVAIWDVEDFLGGASTDLELMEYQVIKQVSNLLNATALHAGYDDIVSVCSYTNDPNERYRNDAIRFQEWRSNVWNYIYSLKDEVISGNIELPSIEEILISIPKLAD